MENGNIVKIIVGVFITVIGGIILAKWGPIPPVYVTNIPSPTPILNLPPNSNDKYNPQLIELNEAFASATKVSTILEKLKAYKFSDIEQSRIADELRKQLLIVETVYKKTYNCDLGRTLKDALNYIIQINDGALDTKNEVKINILKTLIKDIEKRC